MTSQSKRRGRPSKPYRTADGTEVHGLYRLADGRWRITETGERFTEPDEREAVRKYRHWQARHTPESDMPVIVGSTFQGNNQAKDVAEWLNSLPPDAPDFFDAEGTPDGEGGVTFSLPVDGKILWPWLRRALINQPEWLAKMTGVAEVAGLRHLPLPRDPIPLATLWREYEVGNGSEKSTIEATRRIWERFLAHTKATDTNGLTQEVFSAWQADIEATVPGSGTRKLYYSKIKTVLAFGMKRGLDATQLRATLDRARVLWTKAKKPPKRPTPISREDFHHLLNFCDAHPKWAVWRPWLVIGLNLCLHIGEACELRWESFDLQKGTFAAYRGKEEEYQIPRAAVLWPETVAELKKLKAQRRQSEYVFTSHYGTFYNSNKRVNSFAEFRTAAGRPKITFDWIRDGSYTASYAGAPDERFAKVLAGHANTGYTDNYVFRNPELTAPACEAVYKEYFGRRGRSPNQAATMGNGAQ